MFLFLLGHQYGSYRFTANKNSLPSVNEMGLSFKIRARIVQQWYSPTGSAVSLNHIEILSPKNCSFRIQKLTVYLPDDAKQLRRHSQIEAWIILKRKFPPKTIPWPMLDLWETYRPTYVGTLKSNLLIESCETASPSPPSALSRANQQLLALFLKGQPSNLWYERLQPLGLGHLLAISGLHCLIVYLLLQAILIPLRKPAFRTVLTVSGLLLFGHHMGWSASVSRATLMLIIWHILPLFNLPRNTFSIWVFLLLSSLIYTPSAVFSQGFWYTFAASFGLIVARKPLPASPLTHPFRYKLQPWLPIFGAQLMVLPIQLVFGIQAPLGGLFWNLFGGLFLACLLMLAGICLLANTIPFLTPVADTIDAYLAVWLQWLGDHLPEVSLIRFPHTPFVGFLMILGLGLILRFMGREWRWYASIGLISLFCISHRPLSGSRTLMLDVGQGMCFVHVDNHGNTYLFDAGGRMPKRLKFEQVLRLYGGKKIAAAYISHLNWDHYQLLLDLEEAYPIYVPENQASRFRNQAALRRGHTQIAIGQGTHHVAGHLKFQVLSPQKRSTPPNSNEGSFVLLIDGPWGSLLFMGDAGLWAEDRLKLPVRTGFRWLQVGHHGSKTATGDALLRAFQPQVALISVGSQNQFGHPHPSVWKRLAKNKALIVPTSIYGTVELKPELYQDGRKSSR